jgi:hypothetical protein
MKQWLVGYARIPTYHNPPHTAIVEAADGETARQLVKERLNDLGKVTLYVIEPARLYQREDLEGKILSMG